MKKSIQRMIGIGLACLCMTTAGFGQVDNNVNEVIHNDSALVYEGQVRINSLMFQNNEVKEPILLYKGSYYLPMTPKIIENLGIKSAISENGNLGFQLMVPEIDGSPEYLESVVQQPERVEVLSYEKSMEIDDVVIDPAEAFHPVIVYNNTFYIPLNEAILKDGLDLSIYFTEDRELTIHRDIEKMPNGTVAVYPSIENKEYIQNLTVELEALKEVVKSKGSLYESNGQVQYTLTSEDKEQYYIEFDNGDWMVTESGGSDFGKVLYYYANDAFRYVGQYEDGEFKGIGRLIDSEGHFTEIKEFEKDPVRIPYTKKELLVVDKMPTLAVLISFSDESIIGTDEQWSEKLFGDDSNSLNGYYLETSNNNMRIIPALEQEGIKNDGIVRVKLDRLHPNSGEAIGQAGELLEEVFDQLQDQVNMTIYDKNDNGIIDHEELAIVSILAGYETTVSTPADYPQFRSHHSFSDISIGQVDNIGIMNMIYISELEYFSNSTALSTNAVFAHEFGHQLGLPDLYDTDGSSMGLGPFSLMAEGTNNYARGQRPGETIAYMDPWSYIQLKGLTPEVVTESGEYVLNSAETGNYNVIRINTENPDEYFLIENRTLKGRDVSLKTSVKQNGGILIYHVDESVINEGYYDNVVNADEGKKGVDIEEASERITGSVLDSNNYLQRSAPFFTAKGTSTFNEKSRPLSRLNDGKASGIEVEVLNDGPSSKVKITIQ